MESPQSEHDDLVDALHALPVLPPAERPGPARVREIGHWPRPQTRRRDDRDRTTDESGSLPARFRPPRPDVSHTALASGQQSLSRLRKEPAQGMMVGGLLRLQPVAGMNVICTRTRTGGPG